MRANLASVFAVVLLGCGPATSVLGDGSLTTEERALPTVARVQLALPASLTVKLGSPVALHLEGEANLLPHLESRVEDGLLVLGIAEGVALTPTRVIHLELTVPGLRGISSVSLGHVTAPALSAATFTLDVLNRGNVTIERLDAERLETKLTSSGEVRIDAGKVGHQQLELYGRGGVTATGLEATTTKAYLGGSGNAWLWVTDALEVTLRSSGSVRYLGSPEVKVDDSGAGSVEPLATVLDGP